MRLLAIVYCSYARKPNFPQGFFRNGGDDETRTRDLCRDSLGIHVLSATYTLAGAAKSLKRTVGTVRCG